jgi:hypothetical protein
MHPCRPRCQSHVQTIVDEHRRAGCRGHAPLGQRFKAPCLQIQLAQLDEIDAGTRGGAQQLDKAIE